MINDITNSLKANITQKSTNPFLSTFIIVWIIENWKFAYSLFNFDKDCSLSDRIIIINNYFTDYNSWKIFWCCVGLSLLILIITYSLLSLSRLIVNFYDKIVNPQIYKLTDKSSIVLKSIYLDAVQESNRLEEKLDEERASKLRLQNSYDSLEKRFTELLNKPEQKIEPSITYDSPIPTKSESKVDLLYNKLKKEDKAEKFKEVASKILNDNAMKKDIDVTYFITIGLITFSRSSIDSYSYFKFTDDGRKVFDKILFSE